MSLVSHASNGGIALAEERSAEQRTDELRRRVAATYERREGRRRRVLAAADVAGIILAMSAAGLVGGGGHVVEHVAWTAVTLPAWIVLFKLYGLYDLDAKRISHSTVDDIPRLFHALLVGELLLWSFIKLVASRQLILSQALVFGAAGLLLIAVLRWVGRTLRAEALGAERVLLIGEDATTEVLVRKMRAHPEYALEPVGTLAAPDSPHSSATPPILGDVHELQDVVLRHGIERIVVTPTGLGPDEQLEVLRTCRDLALKVSLLPQPFDVMGPGVEIDDVEGLTVIGMNPPQLSRSSRFMKRMLDVVGAVAGLVLLGPLLVLIAVAIKLDSKGGVLFKQDRIGRNGTRFRVWKFRTMCLDAERQAEQLRALSKDPDWLHLDNDPRITRVGAFLRLTSLDELPQLVNVLRGDMSLVGPRPLVESEDALINGWARSRLQLTPGITGSWQVLGRTNIPFEEMVKLDYLYVMNWSLWTDVRLMLRTLPAVVTRRGAN
jgi:exopolysaccharide biosynthesis polyprenyl glycosylphosphotransferase